MSSLAIFVLIYNVFFFLLQILQNLPCTCRLEYVKIDFVNLKTKRKVVRHFMKARDILELLNISRQALAHYVKTSLIRVTEIAPKRYEYCEEDVMLFKEYLDSMERANECETFTVMLLTNDASKVNELSKICEDAKVVINNVTIADESFDRLQLLENLMYRRIYTLVVDDLSIISDTESQLICTLLSRKGCHILTVEDGELVNVVKR